MQPLMHSAAKDCFEPELNDAAICANGSEATGTDIRFHSLLQPASLEFSASIRKIALRAWRAFRLWAWLSSMQRMFQSCAQKDSPEPHFSVSPAPTMKQTATPPIRWWLNWAESVDPPASFASALHLLLPRSTTTILPTCGCHLHAVDCTKASPWVLSDEWELASDCRRSLNLCAQ